MLNAICVVSLLTISSFPNVEANVAEAPCQPSHSITNPDKLSQHCMMPMFMRDFPFGFVSTLNTGWCQMILLENIRVLSASATCAQSSIERKDLDNWNLCHRLMAGVGNASATVCFEKSNIEWTSPGPERRGDVYKFGTVRVYCTKIKDQLETTFATIRSSVGACKPMVQWPDLASPTIDCD